MLTKGQLRVLRMLLSSEDQEIVCCGITCMIDYDHVSRRSVNALLGCMAIKDAGYSSVGTDIYCPNGYADLILKDPELADAMVMRVIRQRAFFVSKRGLIRDT